jgi:hypothetical protein
MRDPNLDALQAQYDDISKRLKTAKKARDAQQRIAGKAVLDAIAAQGDSGSSKMLVELLHLFVVNTEDREVLGLEDLVKKASAAA